MDIETYETPSRKHGYLEALGGSLSCGGGWRYPAFSWLLHWFTQQEQNLLLFVVQLDSGVAQMKVWELCKMGEMWKGGLGCVGLCSPCPRAVGAALPGRWHPLGTGAGVQLRRGRCRVPLESWDPASLLRPIKFHSLWRV